MSAAYDSAAPRQIVNTERRLVLQPNCNFRILPSFSVTYKIPSQVAMNNSTLNPTKSTDCKHEEDKKTIGAKPSSNVVVSPVRAYSRSTSKDRQLIPTSQTIGTLGNTNRISIMESNLPRKLEVPAYGRKFDRMQKLGRIAPEAISPKETIKKRCGWITSQSDARYIAYHDEEWGAPVHHDRRLFELLSLAGLQDDIPWSTILTKRNLYRAAFASFDPSLLATFDDEMIQWISEEALLNKRKVEAIVENAKHVLEIMQEFGSLDAYLWSFVNYKPIVNNYRHGKQIPVKTPKSDAMSKDLMKRGFRGVGATAIYSFMQAAGLTNDHLLLCFRHEECKKKMFNPKQDQRDNPRELNPRGVTRSTT